MCGSSPAVLTVARKRRSTGDFRSASLIRASQVRSAYPHRRAITATSSTSRTESPSRPETFAISTRSIAWHHCLSPVDPRLQLGRPCPHLLSPLPRRSTRDVVSELTMHNNYRLPARLAPVPGADGRRHRPSQAPPWGRPRCRRPCRCGPPPCHPPRRRRRGSAEDYTQQLLVYLQAWRQYLAHAMSVARRGNARRPRCGRRDDPAARSRPRRHRPVHHRRRQIHRPPANPPASQDVRPAKRQDTRPAAAL